MNSTTRPSVPNNVIASRASDVNVYNPQKASTHYSITGQGLAVLSR